MASKTEIGYQIIVGVFIVVAFFAFACPFTGLPAPFFNRSIAPVVVYIGILLVAIVFAPRKLASNQSVIREARALRLLIITFWLELVPVSVVLGFVLILLNMIFDPNNSGESMILAFGFAAIVVALNVCAGPFAFALTPYSVVGGQLINRLIEWVFRLQVG